ncbi:unnamed protein product [Candida verbasci]|uniref:glucan endo-1,3-beta-D-glucosidase n=1 Tax=Candida verbasci TaxID=1227364 RepID=A0A9W4TW37_9ASCO|nr:unnamed protein product [Candida verbasci]
MKFEKKQRSTTISEFRRQQDKPEKDDNDKNSDGDKKGRKLVRSQPFKISRSNSIHVYQEYGKNTKLRNLTESNLNSPMSSKSVRVDQNQNIEKIVTVSKPLIPNTVDDDNAQTPNSSVDQPRNLTNPTVIIRKKHVTDSDYNVNESPIFKSAAEPSIKNESSSPSILYPLLDNVQIDDKFESGESSIVSNDISYTSPVPKFTISKKFIINSLIAVIIILLAICSPTIIILFHGTYYTVNKYFANSSHLSHLQELQNKYLPENVQLQNVVTNNLFYGIAYGPKNSLEPNCGFNKREAMLDLAKLSTITKRLRIYGMQCNQADIILDSIQYMNLDMKLSLGVWIGSDDRSNRNQMELMKRVINKYPSRLFHTIFVGNEVLFRNDKSKQELISYIQEAKQFLRSENIFDIPIGTAEIGSLIDADLLRNCDFVGANIHPFFGGVPVEEASQWTLQFLNHQIQPRNQGINTPIIISEVGWPSGGGSYQRSIASFANSRYFVNSFLCTFRNLPIQYYYFEAFDEQWKQLYWEPEKRWETQWGIFNEDRSNKFSLQNIGCI